MEVANLTDQQRLLKTIQQYDFTLYELNLYLDTHPHCQKGLTSYRKYLKLKQDAVAEYTKRYAPITAEDLLPDATHWDWASSSFPWERSCD
jgi:spore coat protein JB